MPTSTHLNRWLRLQREGRLPDSPWLGHDPQPSLLLDAEARPVDLNPALLQWLDAEASSEVAALLPVNHPTLVRACLEQQRAIEEVEAQWGERVLLWSFIPTRTGNGSWPAAAKPRRRSSPSASRPRPGACTG